MRILVVEDEPDIADAIRRTLEREGLQVDVANDGVDGLWRAREGVYSAIVLDVLLPGMNGYQICAELRSADVRTPVLILTAKTGEYDEVESFNAGADDYLRKPFSTIVLAARVRALLRRGEGERSDSVLRCGSLEFDPHTRDCTVNGDRIYLTPREGAVLAILASNTGQPVSRRRLLDEVWSIDFEGDPNVVDVYVGYLRKKIGSERIRTVRGFGFQMASPDA